ncbi:hypothetical protein [Thiocystis violacea]|uniref:hypothetical protein n=1 Tax=Thiocystis violacea TaxID=13725 RepID=UPI0019051C98|nr:hypothetical protein [Thiocystis violacea]MBK1719617.1 hypothetical protein [Thiocystis violacea]
MNQEERERALLKLVSDYQEGECQTLLEAARAEAGRLLSLAYRQARARLHARVVAERANARERVHAVRAERETRARAGVERANARLLELAWPWLREALVARWREPESRRHWIRFARLQAERSLPPGVWTIRHPPDWASSERMELASRLTGETGRPPRFLADGALRAGLVIEVAGASLDISLDGLLRDRPRLEARLLALMVRADEPMEAAP